nr:esterase/lipase [uncultured bacterium]
MNEKEKIGFLLLHGFSGSPFEMEPVVNLLNHMGFKHIKCPVLPGHCEDITSFKKTRFKDWVLSSEKEFLDLFHMGLKIIVIGLSMGGSIGMYLAERYPVAGLVTIASPVYLYRLFPFEGPSKLLPLIGILRFIKPIVKTQTSKEAKKIAPFGGYDGVYPLHPLHSFIKGLKNIRYNLPLISCPLLVLHSPQDVSVPVSNAWEIITKVRSEIRKLELFPIMEQITSRHLLTTHIETKHRVKKAIASFLQEIIQT